MNSVQAHQSHAKAVIIGKLKKKLKEAHSTLKDLEEQEIVIEKKENILRELSGQIDHQDAGILMKNLSLLLYISTKIYFLKKLLNLKSKKTHCMKL